MAKLVALVLVIFFSVSHLAHADDDLATSQPTDLTLGNYIAGGVVGTAVGLGIGHAVIGDYMGKGWLFTLTEGAALGVFIAGMSQYNTNCVDTPNHPMNCTSGNGLLIGGALAFTAFHIWEIIDVWTYPTRNHIRLHSADQHDGIYVSPLVQEDSMSHTGYGLSLGLGF